MSFPDNDYRAPYIPGPTSPGPTSTGPLYVQSGPQTYGPPQPYQYGPPSGGFQLPPPKRKRRTGLIVAWSIFGVLFLVVGLGVIGALAANTAKTPAASGAGSRATPASCAHGRLANGDCAEDAAAPAKTYPTPAVTDFALVVKTTKKQCFGSAGCNIEFRIDLAYNGTALEPNSAWDITFDMSGVEDPYTATLHMTVGADGLNGSYDQDGGQMVQTKSSKAVLKAVVTSVTAA